MRKVIAFIASTGRASPSQRKRTASNAWFSCCGVLAERYEFWEGRQWPFAPLVWQILRRLFVKLPRKHSLDKFGDFGGIHPRLRRNRVAVNLIHHRHVSAPASISVDEADRAEGHPGTKEFLGERPRLAVAFRTGPAAQPGNYYTLHRNLWMAITSPHERCGMLCLACAASASWTPVHRSFAAVMKSLTSAHTPPGLFAGKAAIRVMLVLQVADHQRIVR